MSTLALEICNKFIEMQVKPCNHLHWPHFWEEWEHGGGKPALCMFPQTPKRRTFNYTIFRHSETPQSVSSFCWKCRNVYILLYLLKSHAPLLLYPLFQSTVIIPKGLLWGAGADGVYVVLSVFCEYNVQALKGLGHTEQADHYSQKFCFIPWDILKINNWYGMDN